MILKPKVCYYNLSGISYQTVLFHSYLILTFCSSLPWLLCLLSQTIFLGSVVLILTNVHDVCVFITIYMRLFLWPPSKIWILDYFRSMTFSERKPHLPIHSRYIVHYSIICRFHKMIHTSLGTICHMMSRECRWVSINSATFLKFWVLGIPAAQFLESRPVIGCTLNRRHCI